MFENAYWQCVYKKGLKLKTAYVGCINNTKPKLRKCDREDPRSDCPLIKLKTFTIMKFNTLRTLDLLIFKV